MTSQCSAAHAAALGGGFNCDSGAHSLLILDAGVQSTHCRYIMYRTRRSRWIFFIPNQLTV